MTFEQWLLNINILFDLIEILQAERGQRRVAEYLRREGIAVFNRHRDIESFAWDEHGI